MYIYIYIHTYTCIHTNIQGLMERADQAAMHITSLEEELSRVQQDSVDKDTRYEDLTNKLISLQQVRLHVSLYVCLCLHMYRYVLIASRVSYIPSPPSACNPLICLGTYSRNSNADASWMYILVCVVYTYTVCAAPYTHNNTKATAHHALRYIHSFPQHPVTYQESKHTLHTDQASILSRHTTL